MEKNTGTFALYCRIAEEAYGISHTEEQDDSVSNVTEWTKQLCAARGIEYDGNTISTAVAAVMAKHEKAGAS